MDHVYPQMKEDNFSPAVRQFLSKHYKELVGKKICCFEKSTAYLEELCSKYDILSQISCIVDSNRRNQGVFSFRGKELEVFGTEYLLQIDWPGTILLITSDYHHEAYERIQNILGDLSDKIEIYYYANQETEYEEEYRREYRNRSLEDIIIFRSGPHAASYVKGMDFADNARALFEYMLSVELNKKYRLVWLVKHPEEFERYKEYENVDFLSFDWSISPSKEKRDAYYHALCLAKYIFFTDAYGFARNCRPDQIRIQLWHGCGFKTRVNFVRCEKRYEYNLVISEVYAKIHSEIYGLRPDQVLITGHSKADWLFHPDKERLNQLDIPSAERYIFWLPTFRSAGENLEQLNEYSLEGETGLPVVKYADQMKELNRLLAAHDMVLVVKLHPFQDKKMIRMDDLSNIVLIENEDLAEQDIQINELLANADALISDYSSAAVDYMLLDRPIGFMLEDAEAYEKSRGFVFDNIREWLPGMELYNFSDVCGFVEELSKGIDSTKEKRRSLCEKMHRYHDDQNCRRVVETFHISD